MTLYALVLTVKYATNWVYAGPSLIDGTIWHCGKAPRL